MIHKTQSVPISQKDGHNHNDFVASFGSKYCIMMHLATLCMNCPKANDYNYYIYIIYIHLHIYLYNAYVYCIYVCMYVYVCALIYLSIYTYI